MRTNHRKLYARVSSHKGGSIFHTFFKKTDIDCQALISRLEMIMAKTPPNDRCAARKSNRSKTRPDRTEKTAAQGFSSSKRMAGKVVRDLIVECVKECMWKGVTRMS